MGALGQGRRQWNHCSRRRRPPGPGVAIKPSGLACLPNFQSNHTAGASEWTRNSDASESSPKGISLGYVVWMVSFLERPLCLLVKGQDSYFVLIKFEQNKPANQPCLSIAVVTQQSWNSKQLPPAPIRDDDILTCDYAENPSGSKSPTVFLYSVSIN